jgi:hypothetical protein
MIEVNEYVRTNKGVIGKLISETLSYPEPSEWILKANNNKIVIVECDDYPVKHSKQLIDLIDFGDFVNGIKVVEKGLDKNDNVSSFSNGHDEVRAKDIKAILTKEQMEANQYVVK